MFQEFTLPCDLCGLDISPNEAKTFRGKEKLFLCEKCFDLKVKQELEEV